MEAATNRRRRGRGFGLGQNAGPDQLGGERLQCRSTSLATSCSALRSLPETRARERRAIDKNTNVRVYGGGIRRVVFLVRAGMR